MKIKLLILSLLAITFSKIQAQSIGIIGTATPNGWSSDTNMTSTDNIFYVLANQTLTSGQLKFRQDDSWAINWGGTNFPTDTGTSNGANITVPAGTYTIYFNRLSGGYSFVLTTAFPTIGIWGPAVDIMGYGGPEATFYTSDGVDYILSAFNYSGGSAYLRQDGCSGLTFGSTSFPSGTAAPSGPTLQVPGGLYSCKYNATTRAYSFALPSIGILGTAVSTGWSSDINMNTADGYNYTLNNVSLTAGQLKFRLDDLWNYNWGGSTFPSGTGQQSGANIVVPAGTYNVTFNRNTLAYSFTNTLTNQEFSNFKLEIVPNPSYTSWNITANETIEDIELFDAIGKIVLKLVPNSDNVTIDGTKFNSGIYFAKITSGNSVQTIKLIKN